MNGQCEEFRALWSAWHAGQLDPESARRCAAEHERCSACARYDRQMRALVGALGRLPLPDAQPETTRARPPDPPRRRWATAAAVVVAFAAGVLTAQFPLGSLAPNTNVSRAEAVEIRPQQTENIQVAVSVPRRMDEVDFTIEMPRGVELEGYPGQRIVQWRGQLSAGRSRLTLPVRATGLAADAEVVARIQHENGSRELRVPIEFIEATSRASEIPTAA